MSDDVVSPITRLLLGDAFQMPFEAPSERELRLAEGAAAIENLQHFERDYLELPHPADPPRPRPPRSVRDELQDILASDDFLQLLRLLVAAEVKAAIHGNTEATGGRGPGVS